MQLKKLITLLLLAAILISSVSCAPTPPSEGENTEAYSTQDVSSDTKTDTETEAKAETEPESNSGQIVLFEGGKWNYRIVTRSVRSAAEVEFSSALIQEINGIAGSAPHAANDLAIKDDSVCEIIVGYTRHPSVRELYSSLGYGDASVSVSGNKIYLSSYTAEGFDALLRHVVKQLKAGYRDGRLTISPKEFETRITLNADFNLIPTVSTGSFSCVTDCGYGQTLIVISDSTKSDFDAYVEKLKDYPCTSSVSEAGNEFATFDFGAHLLNVSFSKHDNGLRIILNKNTEPTELFTKPDSTKKICEPMLIMHGLAWKQAGYTYYGYGMCMLLRLSDGRFIVIDGGFNRRKDADDLYALLKKYTPSGTPTVAMWIITHAHIDHHGTFAMQFLTNYRTKVTVENVIFNPPGGDVLTAPANESVSGLMNGHIVINNAIKRYNASNIRSHVGDRYYVGDAVIDILYTVDYQYPKQFNYYNTSSMILSITIAGQRIMITGDASNEAFGKAVKMYGSALKSDMVQVAHHGGTSGVSASEATFMSEGYTLMSPSIVLWPASDESYASSSKSAFNKVLLALSTIEEVVVAGDRDFAVTLPYKP